MEVHPLLVGDISSLLSSMGGGGHSTYVSSFSQIHLGEAGHDTTAGMI